MARPIFFAIVLLFLSAPAAADDFLGTRPMGMGGAHRAIVTGNDAIFLNPAGMSLFRRYSFELQYLLAPEYGAEGGPDQHVVHASVVDNQLQYFATGLAYTRVQRGDDKTGNRYDLAFSVPIGQNLLVGADVKYLDFDKKDRADLDAVTVDVGVLLRTSFGLNFGVVGYNLTNTADYIEHPISMAAAVMYSPFRTLEISFDWFINFQKLKDLTEPTGEKETGYSYAFGIEYLLLGQITIRAGYLIDHSEPTGNDQYWSLGLGYVSQTFAFDFGYRGSVNHTDWGNHFGLGARLFM
jgi:opacity protein-like surface antigen